MGATQQGRNTAPDFPEAGVLAPSSADSRPVFDLLRLVTINRRLLSVATLVAGLLGFLIASLMKPVYTATALIMPPQAAQSSLSAMLGQLGSLSALGGASNLLKNPADLYVGILQSRTISDETIQHFDLAARWHTKTMVSARKALDAHVRFEAAKDGLIEISATEHDPKLASALANFFVDALYHVNSSLAVSEASQRRLFFERELDEEKTALAQAEDALKATQQKTGLITVTGQTELAIRNIAQTRAEISARQVELQGLRSYESDSNPDVSRLEGEIKTLEGQLASLEDKQSRLAPGDTEVSASQIPGSGLEYARELRDVKYHDTLLELLSRQYEAARIDEAKSAPVIQVVDRAIPPDQKSGPSRVLIALGCAVAGFLLAFAWLFLRTYRTILS